MIFKRCAVVIFLLILSMSIFADESNDENKDTRKNSKYNENRLQFGFGVMVSTGNLLGMIESVRMYNSIKSDTDYDYPGLSDEDKESLQELEGSMQRAILIANIFGSMEYGLQLRILWRALIIETDLVLTPYDGSYNGRMDFTWPIMVGVRAPFFIMPYIMAGVNFTFSFYPDEFVSKENWKGDWAATDNFVFRPGLSTRAGLDFKFKKFSLGAYYQYTIKDFEEFTAWYGELTSEGVSSSDAVVKIFGAQSRFGITLCWYLSR